MTYREAIDFLYSLRWFGAKLGLRNTLRLAELAGNPHHRLKFIHVAGTNGKGSTCAMLDSIYGATGVRTGLFTSPHLVNFGERIQVNREPLAELELVQLVSEFTPLLAQFPKEEHPTFFEVVTVMALTHFARHKCDLVIWETGLGGRLDATNIVTPLVSVITNIQYDHQTWLGETLGSIAAEKAGIIKPGKPVITGAENPEALNVIRATAAQQDAPLRIVKPDRVSSSPLTEIQLPLPGKHQRMNAAVALETVEALQAMWAVNDRQIRQGLEQVKWPGRLQLIRRPSGQQVLLDGAHNTGGAETLANALREDFRPPNLTLILGILRDKDWTQMCRLLAPLARQILLVPVHSERTADPHALAEACHHARPDVPVRELPSLKGAMQEASNHPFVTIAGSLYLVGEAMELLGVSPLPAHPERALNEWGHVPLP